MKQLCYWLEPTRVLENIKSHKQIQRVILKL